MFKVSIFYPAGNAFDMEYYRTKHMPMVKEKIGPACTGIAVDQGIAGGAPGAPPTYVAIGHIFVESLEPFQAAMANYGKEIMADVKNYTDAHPTIQISEVVL